MSDLHKKTFIEQSGNGLFAALSTIVLIAASAEVQAQNLSVKGGTSSGPAAINTNYPAGHMTLHSPGYSFLTSENNNHFTANLYWDGTNWNRYNTGSGGAMWWSGSDGQLGTFQVGPGNNPVTALSNPLWITAAGNVGIGTTGPSSRLTLQDPSSFDPNGTPLNALRFGHVHAPNGWDATGVCSGNSTGGTPVCMAANGGFWFWGAQSGPTTMVSTMWLGPTGNLITSGSITQNSRRESKDNIRELSDSEALTVLRNLHSVKFEYKADRGTEEVGFIADDSPTLVAGKDHRGIKVLDTVAVLTRVVQLQQQQMERQNAELRDLKATLRGLSPEPRKAVLDLLK
jgi:hypothetical protein